MPIEYRCTNTARCGWSIVTPHPIVNGECPDCGAPLRRLKAPHRPNAKPEPQPAITDENLRWLICTAAHGWLGMPAGKTDPEDIAKRESRRIALAAFLADVADRTGAPWRWLTVKDMPSAYIFPLTERMRKMAELQSTGALGTSDQFVENDFNLS